LLASQKTTFTDDAEKMAWLQGCMQQMYRRGAAGEPLVKFALTQLVEQTDSRHGYVALRQPASDAFFIFCVVDCVAASNEEEGRRLAAEDFSENIFGEESLLVQAKYTEKVIDITILARHAREKFQGGHLSVPVFVGKNLAGVIGLMGRSAPYASAAVQAVEMVMGYALSIERVQQLEVADTQETDYRNIFELTNDGMAVINPLTEKVLHANTKLCGLLGLSLDELLGRSLLEFEWNAANGYDLEGARKLVSLASRSKRSVGGEWMFRRRDGKTIWTQLQMKQGLIAEREYVFVSVRDIGDEKQMQEKLSLISEHDPLTGLYNRAVFDRCLTGHNCNDVIGLVLCDIDGLRLINESAGDHTGDAVLVALGEFLQEICPTETEKTFRIGGDMFAVLLGAKSELVPRQIARQIEEFARTRTGIAGFSISAAALKFAPGDDLSKKLRQAEGMLHRQKMHCERSEKNGVAQMLTQALATRDNITGGHADRMEEMCVALLRDVAGEEAEATDMRLFAKFHDIGKIGIPDDLLFKPGRLLPEEYQQMKLHSKLGANIARASSALAPIADLILMHHERWDGYGYPLGKKAREIPLECRILAVVDAFDAMTSDRPYRRAMDIQAAMNELFLHAGTQFDPELVERFSALRQRQRHSRVE
jgi:PAS domain S-box-containing protein/diguanylate cyclase (GGDEF)-like protein